MAVFTFNESFLESALSYDQYRKGLHAWLKHPPADEAAVKMILYTQKNQDLMDEYDQAYRIGDALRATVEKAPALTWVVITEGWCGDAAFNVPMFALLEDVFPEKIKLRLFLRDKNPELMDAYLTEGGRSIPKLVLLDQDLKDKGTWGPRPAPLMTKVGEWKEAGDPLKEMIRKTKEWYDADQTVTLQQELNTLLSGI
ncbi:MAG: thioredoxin family protein [Chitinophagaceae bacterium]|nr:MAG: thioredoxin family protein [Chitinophagaceae bacterium]